jgi:CDP-diacylglycerol--serine O-phosphatidyltransferase
MRMSRYAPSAATLANAGAGLLACGLAVHGNAPLGALLVLLAVLLDAVDGALARSLDASSEFGAELDSLADVISFGVAPAMLVGSLLAPDVRSAGWALLLAYPLCAAWRLARFNVRHGERPATRASFVGLPTTGAGAAAATALLLHARLLETGFAPGDLLLPSVMVALGALMVSRIPYRHAGSLLGRLSPASAVGLGALFVVASVVWQHEYVFAAPMWAYALSGPLATAREKLRAVRHA